ncbi:MAG TPA: sn-glycerol-3-phosphate ABC transporter ATP-binding protein UgpC [Candidatus Acidoferrales bacterium]|nr:sn-glycerol-3-phosphate ABC transporter ATP-binding protein UgpC [Candidatus Acidoferrales bacterium]
MARVCLKNITKRFGGKTAVDRVTLEVKDREFVVLVGPSGCGKTTVLRMVAGLEQPSSGEIVIGERLVNDIPPKDRNVAMVFQNYALYPHMTVYKNMAIGLELRKLAKDAIAARVREAAEMLRIEELLERKPAQLSGGERQRVAMGRAIVRKPEVFLFDEPLSNLDAKLRVRMRAEIKQLHERVKTTVIYVTHDQVEAMTLADRMVVMNRGVVLQEGPPQEIYRRPRNLFVAGFIGAPPMNFLRVRLARNGSAVRLEADGTDLTLPEKRSSASARWLERDLVLGIRPEHVVASAECPGPNYQPVDGSVELAEPLGAQTAVHVRTGGQEMVVLCDPENYPRAGSRLRLWLDMDKIHLFDPATESAIE